MTASARLFVGLAALLLASACSDSEAPTATGAPAESAPAAPAALLENSEVDVVGEPLPPLEDPSADLAIGSPAPVITGQSFDGSSVTIGEPSDGPTLLVFLAHWCPHCNDEIPELNELRDSDALPADLDVVGVSTAVAPDRDNFPPSQWIVEKDWTWPVLADSETADAFVVYGGSGFPYSVMLDADGRVLARKAGSASASQIAQWIDAALNPTT